MAYLLILPTSLYIALATLVLYHRPRSISYAVLGLYAIASALATAGYLVLGTTHDATAARIAAGVVIIASSWAYMALMPLALLALYFAQWFDTHRRPALLIAVAGQVIILLSTALLATHDDLPLALEVSPHYWSHWILTQIHLEWQLGAGSLILSQVPSTLIIGAALRRKRLSFWRGAVAILIVNVSSVLLPMLAPLAGTRWATVVIAVGYFPPVALHTVILVRAARVAVLDSVIASSLTRYNDTLLVLDAEHQVIWTNAQAAHWITQPTGELAPQPITRVLRGTLLLSAVQELLDSDVRHTEIELVRDGAEVAVRLELHSLGDLRHVSGAKLLIVRDITTTRVLLNMYAQRAGLQALSAISADIASTLDLEQVIVRALQQVQMGVQADVATVYLRDSADDTRLVRAGFIANPAAEPLSARIPSELPLRGTTAGWVVQNAQPIFTPDARKNLDDGARITHIGLRAGASVPLTARDRVIGVLQVGMLEPREFDPVTMALIESVGRQLGVALDNAQLHAEERHQRRVAEALSAVAGILTTQTLDDALQALLDHFQQLIDFERGSVLLFTAPGELSISAYTGFEDVPEDGSIRNVRINIGKYPYLQSLFTNRIPQMVSDTSTDPRWTVGEFSFGSWIGVPLVIHGQMLGLLSISHREPGYFTPRHLQLATTFADQAVIAVENARLFDAEHRRRAQAEFLQQASYELLNSTDLDSALMTAITLLSESLQFDHARLGLIDEERKVWISRANYPDTVLPQHGAVLPLNYYPLVGKMVRDQQPFLIDDTRNVPEWIPSPPGEPEIRSWIGVPLVARGRTVGILNLYSFHPHAFTTEQFDTTRLFANQVATALESFRLMDATTRQNQMLTALNTILATSTETLTDNERMLNSTLARVLETLDLPGGMIHQYDDTAKYLYLSAASGISHDIQDQLRHIPVDGTLDTQTLPPVTSGDSPAVTFFSVPLNAHGHPIGLLSIVWPADQPVDDATREQLTGIGRQLGVVLDNAILFATTTRRATLLTKLNRLSTALSAELEHHAILTLLSEQSLHVFDAQLAYIWLIEDTELVGAATSDPNATTFVGQRRDLTAEAGLLTAALTNRCPCYANHLAHDPTQAAVLEQLEGAQAALAVPLLKGEQPIGVLLLINRDTPDVFGDWLREQAAVLGAQAALAIQNAALFNEARRRVDQLRLVNETSRYATAILSLPHLVESMVQMLAHALRFDIVGLLESTPQAPVFQAIHVVDHAVVDPLPDSLCDDMIQLAEQAMHITEPQLKNIECPLVLTSETTHTPDEAEKPSAETLCALAVPMIIADEVTGMLLVARQGTHTITSDDLDVLEPLAAQLATAVSNARLYEKVRQQTIALEARVASRTDEIRRQQERTEAILHSVADAVIVFDLQAQVVLTNPVARTLFDKYDLEMDLSTRVRRLVAPLLNDTPDNNRDLSDTFEIGSVALQALAAPVRDEDQTPLGAVVVMRDISQMRELDRLKDQFVSNVSHELRTPMANLKLYLSLLEQGRPERYADYMEVMHSEVERLERLINDLLQLSRLRNEKHTLDKQVWLPLNIAGLIENVIRGNRARAHSEQKTLHHESDAPLPTGYGNPDQIIRALMNLVGNALAYTEPGDSIIVRSRAEPVGQKKAEWVIIEIVDTGMGIPSADLPTIFERFIRGSNVSPTTSGTGLGLAIVKDIIDLHKGRIEVESVEGQGSTFRIWLPAYKGGNTDTLVEKDV